jgi:hypothetical protein
MFSEKKGRKTTRKRSVMLIRTALPCVARVRDQAIDIARGLRAATVPDAGISQPHTYAQQS